jgi:dihydrofolate reductase
MRKVIVSEFLTLDGVMEDPGGAEGFEHGGWSFTGGGDDDRQYKYEELFAADALLLGRKTYQGFASAWPQMGGDNGYGDRMNNLPKYVASNTLTDVDWNATLIRGDLAEEVTRLKQQPGQDILVFGSGALARSLAERDLVDEYRLMIHPVALGTGQRLFADGFGKQDLKLADTKTFTNGIVLLVYGRGKNGAEQPEAAH